MCDDTVEIEDEKESRLSRESADEVRRFLDEQARRPSLCSRLCRWWRELRRLGPRR